MAKEIDEFLMLYKTYENLLKARGTTYRDVEDEQVKEGVTRMTIMRQMRNYLSHVDDPGFIAISSVCLKTLEKMVKEEQLHGDIVKNHLITPAKGSIKYGTMLSSVICQLAASAKDGRFSLPVYDAQEKRLKGTIELGKAASELDKRGNIPLTESVCGPFGKIKHLLRPDELVPESVDNIEFYCCTKDGTLESQYMGYLDN